ncbi:MAG: hypothetical protein AMJ43_01410 [Coxiella sp. DG_40]|nr:MAG: hypothetical protein AMJ43_01410 [Coxiella sp. DG_40]
MNTNNTSCFYFPTTVIIVDDNQSFLSNIVLKLDRKIPFLLSSEPGQAVEILRNNSRALDFANQAINYIYDEEIDLDQVGEIISINIPSIHRQVYNPKRFSNISVVLVDYLMPNINGVEFCRKIQDLPIKKIMVTGVADHKTAVSAFNEGIIDKFIVKDVHNVFEEINNAITELQKSYFNDLSRNLIRKAIDCLNNQSVAKVFNFLLKKYRLLEYYLVESSGSFLCLDLDANPVWFVIKSDKELKEYLNIAYDNYAPNNVISALTNKTHIPFLFSEKEKKLPVSKWVKYLFPAKMIEDDKTYYYAVIKQNNFSLNIKNIKSLNSYLSFNFPSVH